jgi:hypothetical protein
MNADVSDGGNSEGGPPADPVSDFEDNSEEDDTVEAAPLPRIEDAPHSLEVAVSTQPQNIGSNEVQGALSGIWKLCMHSIISCKDMHFRMLRYKY